MRSSCAGWCPSQRRGPWLPLRFAEAGEAAPGVPLCGYLGIFVRWVSMAYGNTVAVARRAAGRFVTGQLDGLVGGHFFCQTCLKFLMIARSQATLHTRTRTCVMESSPSLLLKRPHFFQMPKTKRKLVSLMYALHFWKRPYLFTDSSRAACGNETEKPQQMMFVS